MVQKIETSEIWIDCACVTPTITQIHKPLHSLITHKKKVAIENSCYCNYLEGKNKKEIVVNSDMKIYNFSVFFLYFYLFIFFIFYFVFWGYFLYFLFICFPLWFCIYITFTLKKLLVHNHDWFLYVLFLLHVFLPNTSIMLSIQSNIEKWLSVHLWTKLLWVRVTFQSLKPVCKARSKACSL